MKYVIDGSFLLEKTSGVIRYAYEIVNRLDRMAADLDIEILVPEGKLIQPVDYKNIRMVRHGSSQGKKWLQIDYARYVKENHARPVCMTNLYPLMSKGGIACIHDIAFKMHPELFTAKGDWHEILFRKLMYLRAFHKADQVVTVSETSRKEILSHYHLKNPNVAVIGNAWQHYDVTDMDETIFDQLNGVHKGDYYFFLSSLAVNKNLLWILKNAEQHPEEQYVLTGQPLGDESLSEYRNLKNVTYTGYLEDAQIRALLKHCKAFLFPSTYEGFGIPPMEALCMGAKIVISKIDCLREIYGSSAYYIDPANPQISIDELLKEEVSPAKDVLERYSWDRSASELCHIIQSL